MDDVAHLAGALAGGRLSVPDGLAEWRYHGRLVALGWAKPRNDGVACVGRLFAAMSLGYGDRWMVGVKISGSDIFALPRFDG